MTLELDKTICDAMQLSEMLTNASQAEVTKETNRAAIAAARALILVLHVQKDLLKVPA